MPYHTKKKFNRRFVYDWGFSPIALMAFPSLTSVTLLRIDGNRNLQNLSLARLETASSDVYVHNNPELTTVSLPRLQHIVGSASVQGNGALAGSATNYNIVRFRGCKTARHHTRFKMCFLSAPNRRRWAQNTSRNRN